MKKLYVVVALAATVLAAMAVPAAADPPTVPLEADCDGDLTTFDFILAQGSLVGFVDGVVAVIHELDVELETVIAIEGGGTYGVNEVFASAAGSQGLTGLTECTFGRTPLSENMYLGPLTTALVRQAAIFYGIDLSDEPRGSDVYLSDWTEGTFWVQFPRS